MPPRRAALPVLRLVFPLAVIPLALAGCGRFAPDRIAGVPAGFASHQLCGARFIAGQDPDAYWRGAQPPALRALGSLLRIRPDAAGQAVEADVAGLGARRDQHRGEAGCLTLPASAAARFPPAPALPPFGPPLLAPIADGPAPVETADPALRAAIEASFVPPAPGLPPEARAVVVLHRGRVIAERYAPGLSPETRVEGWSATKTVTNALLGILVQQGRLVMDAPAPVPEWRGADDPRRGITPAQLLRMTSGLEFGGSLDVGLGDVVNPPTQMLYDGVDMGAAAAAAPAIAAPGTRFRYSNGDTQILSRIIRDLAGGDEAAALGFARSELFGPLGMRSAVLESDIAGSPVGSSGMWATPRDWARLGLLFARDGVVGGRRLLPSGWVEASVRPTPGSEAIGYGAGVWTNRGGTAGGRLRIAAGMPEEAFLARGAFGQYVVVVPSRDLVVARFGHSHDPRNRMEQVAAIVAAAMAATAGR